MFKNYKEEGQIKGIREQYNIMAFIGNGFDISVLKKYRDDNLVSSYTKFYDFLGYKGFNVLYKKMREDKCSGKENWSDFECSLGELLQSSALASELEDALKEMQSMFLLFLNEIVTPDVLLKLNDDIEKNRWSRKTLSCSPICFHSTRYGSSLPSKCTPTDNPSDRVLNRAYVCLNASR